MQASQDFAPLAGEQGTGTPLMSVVQNAAPVQMQVHGPDTMATGPENVVAMQPPVPDVLQAKEEEAETLQMQPALQLAPADDPDSGDSVMPMSRQASATSDVQMAPIQRSEEEEVVQEKTQASIFRQASDPGDEPIQKSDGQQASATSATSTSGNLPEPIQAKATSVLGHDFSGVQVSESDSATSLNARAYAQGESITFAPGQYDPGSTSGQQLIGHELTHVAQQREGRVQPTVQKKGYRINDDRQLEREADQKGWQIAHSPATSVDTEASVTTAPATTGAQSGKVVQGSIISDILDYIDLGDVIDSIPGYSLLCYLIGYDFLRGSNVERNAHSLVKGLLGLIGPLGLLLYNKLNQYGALDSAFGWLDRQVSSLNISYSRVMSTLDNAWEDMDLLRFDVVSYNLGVLGRHFGYLKDEVVNFASGIVDQVIDFLTDSLVSPLVGYLEEQSPAYRLATKVLRRRFPLEDPVEATTEEIIIDFLVLIGKEEEIAQMQERGVIGEMAQWIDTQLGTFMSLLGRFTTIVSNAWDAFSLDNLSNIPGIFSGILTDFTDLLGDFLTFAGTVALKVLELVKKALLGWLASFANDIPGFHLLSVILGMNPFTSEPVERNVQNIIRGFMGLMPGGEEQYQQMVETGAVPRAAGQIEALMAELGISWDMVVGIFTGIWNEMTIENFIEPLATFQRITDAFLDPIQRLFTFVVKVVKVVVILILEIMNFPFELISSIIANVQSAFEDISRDPIEFLKNLLRAVKQGVQQFFEKFHAGLFIFDNDCFHSFHSGLTLSSSWHVAFSVF